MSPAPGPSASFQTEPQIWPLCQMAIVTTFLLSSDPLFQGHDVKFQILKQKMDDENRARPASLHLEVKK